MVVADQTRAVVSYAAEAPERTSSEEKSRSFPNVAVGDHMGNHVPEGNTVVNTFRAAKRSTYPLNAQGWSSPRPLEPLEGCVGFDPGAPGP